MVNTRDGRWQSVCAAALRGACCGLVSGVCDATGGVFCCKESSAAGGSGGATPGSTANRPRLHAEGGFRCADARRRPTPHAWHVTRALRSTTTTPLRQSLRVGGCLLRSTFDGLEAAVRGNTSSAASRLRRTPLAGRSLTVLWTILVILAIVALALFIFSRVRGGRGRV